MPFFTRNFILLILILILYVRPVVAFEVQIPEPYFSTQALDVSHLVYVSNNREELTFITLEIRKSHFTIEGEEVLTDTDDFLIYPNKLLLHPGETMTVSVQYLGNANIEQEVAYRLITDQVGSIGDGKKKKRQPKNKAVGSFNLSYKYVNRLYVKPDNIRPELNAVEVKRVQKNDAPYLRVTVENTGTAHGIVSGFDVNLHITTLTEKLYEETLRFSSHETGHHNILAKETRHIYLPWPEDIVLPDDQAADLLIKAEVKVIQTSHI